MRTLQLLLGSLAVLNGAFRLALVVCSSTAVDPAIHGLEWWKAVFGKMVRAGMDGLAVGLISLIVGVWLILVARRRKTPQP
jgi:hypothetical protein